MDVLLTLFELCEGGKRLLNDNANNKIQTHINNIQVTLSPCRPIHIREGPKMKLALILMSCLPLAQGFSSIVSLPKTAGGHQETAVLLHAEKKLDGQEHKNNRRSFLYTAGAAFSIAVSAPQAAFAGIDPNALKALPVQGDVVGGTTRLRQIEALKNPESDTVDQAWEELTSGVAYRDYRVGRGEATIQPGSKVAAEMTIRMKSFSSANEPGGIKYFSTKEDTDFNEVAFKVGSGEISAGLEEGMMGMKKGGLRRIEVPSELVFAARNANQLPLPTTKDGKRRFENLFKTDATLLFEVLVTRVK
jgi:FKBP-type peptidyl-prolyl cis-trans isomerase FkpA